MGGKDKSQNALIRQPHLLAYDVIRLNIVPNLLLSVLASSRIMHKTLSTYANEQPIRSV